MPTTDSRKLLAAVGDESRRQGRHGATPATARQTTPIFIVASPRPRSGKTFVARLLIDFLRLDNGSVRAFDLGTGLETLQDCLPGVALAVDIRDIQGQMALFDRLILNDAIAKVIDLDSGNYRTFFGIVENIGLIAELQRRAIEPIVLFAADQHPASEDAFASFEYRFRDLLVVPVFNEAIVLEEALRGRFAGHRGATVPLRIPCLSAGLKARIERPPRSFADFHTELPQDLSVGEAFELRAWTRRTFLEFRELQLRLLLEKLRTSLPGVAR